MERQVEFRSDHDPAIAGSATAPAPAKRPLRLRMRRWVLALLLCALIAGWVAGSAFYARHIYYARKWEDLPSLIEMLLPLGFLAWFIYRLWSAKRRRREVSGATWTVSAGNRTVGSRVRPQVRMPVRMDLLSVGRSLVLWARRTALSPSTSFGLRALAWIVLISDVVMAVVFLVSAIAILFMSFKGDHPLSQRLLFVCIGLASLYFFGKNVELLRYKSSA